MEINPAWPSFGVRVGPLGIRCAGADGALIARLARRYAGFELDGPPDFEAGLDLRPVEGAPGSQISQPGAVDWPQVRFREGRMLVDGPACEGWIDARQRRGWLSASTARPLEEVEYFLRLATALLVFERGGVLFHAAAVERSGQACVFFGKSGSGKTTAARNSPAGSVLNDDLVVLFPDGGGWKVWSTPFWNPTQVRPARLAAPLAALFRLVQDKRVYLEPVSPGAGLAEIMASFPVITLDAERSPAVLARAMAVLQAVPVRRLHFLADDSYWPVVDRFLEGKNQEISS